MAWPKRLNLISFGCSILRLDCPRKSRCQENMILGRLRKTKRPRKQGCKKKFNPPRQESRCKFLKSWGILYYRSVNFIYIYILFGAKNICDVEPLLDRLLSGESRYGSWDHEFITSNPSPSIPVTTRIMPFPNFTPLLPTGEGCKSHTLEMWQTRLNLINL